MFETRREEAVREGWEIHEAPEFWASKSEDVRYWFYIYDEANGDEFFVARHASE